MSIPMINVVTSLRFSNMRQGEIAGRLGISDARFSRFCRGEVLIPVPIAVALAELIGRPVEEVIQAFMLIWNGHKVNK